MHRGSGSVPGERRLATVLQVSALALSGSFGVGLVAWLGLTGAVANVMEFGSMGALLAGALLPAFRRWGRPHMIEIDWRREEVRVISRRSAVTLAFAGVTTVACESRWRDNDRGLLFDVYLVGSHDRLHVGTFNAEEPAQLYAAELRELIGVTSSV